MFSNAYPQQFPSQIPAAFTLFNTSHQLDTLSKQRRLYTFLEQLFAYQIGQYHHKSGSASSAVGPIYQFFHGFGPTVIVCTLIVWAALCIEASSDSLMVQALKQALLLTPIAFCTTAAFTLTTAGRLPWEPAWANRFCRLDPQVQELIDQTFTRLVACNPKEVQELQMLFDLEPTHALGLWRSYQTVHERLENIEAREILRSLDDEV